MKEKINPEKGYKTKHMNLQLFAAPRPSIIYRIYIYDNETLIFDYNYYEENGPMGYIYTVYEYLDTIEYPKGIYINREILIKDLSNYDGLRDSNNNEVISGTILCSVDADVNPTEVIPGTDITFYTTSLQQGYSSTITLTNCRCTKSSETGLSGLYSATVTADNGYYLSSVISELGTVTIAENKKTAEITINDVTADFAITAIGTVMTKKTIIMHPNDNGITDYTTKVHPTLNKASSDDIDDIFFGSWEAPTQEGEDLSLSQAYSATQNGDILALE